MSYIQHSCIKLDLFRVPANVAVLLQTSAHHPDLNSKPRDKVVVFSMLVFYSDVPSSIPAHVYTFYFVKTARKE